MRRTLTRNMAHALLRRMGKMLLLAAVLLPFLGACATVSEKNQLISHARQILAENQCQRPDPESSIKDDDMPLDGHGFAVTSWNIYKQQLPGWAEDLRQLAAQSDILLLQEARLNDALIGELEALSLRWTLNPAFYQVQGYAGVMTAARISAQKVCAEQMMEPWLRVPKTTIVSYYPIDGHQESVLVVNIHGVNFTFDEVQLTRQLRQIGSYIREHQGPLVVAGDFNTWSQPRQRAVQAFAVEVGLRQVTFASQQPAQHFGRSVDHIYIRGLKKLRAEVKVVTSSDHYPLTVTLALEKD